MPDRSRFDIVIAGASFAGMALARALADALGPGVRIGLADRQQRAAAIDRADPRASAISAASRRLLESLGAWSAIAPAAQQVSAVEITDSPLTAGLRPVLLSYDPRLDDGGTAEPAMHIVPNAALALALEAAVRAAPGIVALPGIDACGIALSGGSATLQAADGSSIVADLLVAADGRQSRLRQAAGIGIVGWSYPQAGIVTTLEHERPHHGRAVQHFLPAGPFAILPLPGNRCCVTWTEDRARAEAILALNDAGFLEEVDLRFGGRLGALSLAGPRQSWPLDMHLARSYIAPRLALIGDAAHAVHPIAGQGLNLALRDVAALAECIADGMRLGLAPSDVTILQRYERWRRFDSAASAAAFDALNRLFSSDAAWLRSAREAGLGLVDRLPALKRWLVAEAAGVAGDTPRLLRGLPA